MAYWFLMQKPKSQATSDTRRHLVGVIKKHWNRWSEETFMKGRAIALRNLSSPTIFRVFPVQPKSSTLGYWKTGLKGNHEHSSFIRRMQLHKLTLKPNCEGLHFFYINCLLAALNKIKALGYKYGWYEMKSLWYNYKIPSINYPCYPRIKAKQRTLLKDINKLQRTFNTQSKFKIY